MVNKFKLFIISTKARVGVFVFAAMEIFLHLFNIPHWH